MKRELCNGTGEYIKTLTPKDPGFAAKCPHCYRYINYRWVQVSLKQDQQDVRVFASHDK